MSLSSAIFKSVPSRSIPYENAEKKYLKKLDGDKELMRKVYEEAFGHPMRIKFLVDRIKQPDAAMSAKEFKRMKFNTLKFDGKFAECFGKVVETSAVWIIWAKSGHGKTTLTLQIAQYLSSKFGPAIYDSMEEGRRFSFQQAINRLDENQLDSLQILHREEIPDLIIRAERRKSPQFYIIDSLQYIGFTKQQYKEFKSYMVDYLGKSLIFISHAEGNEPAGAVAGFVRYDADIKIHVNRFRAFPDPSRYGGNNPYDIVPDLAKLHHGEIT